MPAGHRLSRPPLDTPRPRDHSTPVPHSSPRCPRQKKGRRRRTRRAGCVGRCPSGDGLFGPRERRGSPGSKGFPSFLEGISLPGFFLSCPRFRVSICMEGVFFQGMEHYYPPSFFLHPRFRLSSRALDNERRRFPWFEPHVSSFFLLF